MPPGNIALRLDLEEPRKAIDNVLLPCPRHHGSQMRPHLIRSTAWIPSLLGCGVFVNPIEGVADLFRPEILERDGAAPSSPFSERRRVLLAGPLCWISRTEAFSHYGFESRRRRWSPTPTTTATLPDPFRPVALCCASCRVKVDWPDLDGPRPRVIGRAGGCTGGTDNRSGAPLNLNRKMLAVAE
jgi:hypothetical protein